MKAIRNASLFALSFLLLSATGCGKKFEIRDVDPGQAGEVRSIGPESQDAIRVAEQMSRSLLAEEYIQNPPNAPTIVMLPVTNDSSTPFNKEIFSTRLRVELNRYGKGQIRFVLRDNMADIEAEREAKRAGEVDYDPSRQAPVVAGADYFLKGYVVGDRTASRKGMAGYHIYTFSLLDPETGIELWNDFYEVKREGKDDVLYR